MKSHRPRRPGVSLRRAFSLVEVLVVLVLIIGLAAASIPAVIPLIHRSKMNQAVVLLTEELNLARQSALTRNREVEVRIYQIASGGEPADGRFTAMRSFFANGTDPTKAEALEKIRYFPAGVVISSDPKYSTLLDYSNADRGGLSYLKENVSGTPTPYVSFLFRPDGGTHLTPVTPPLGNWYVTLYIGSLRPNASTGLPDDYYTAQIDPVTGRVRSYRP